MGSPAVCGETNRSADREFTCATFFPRTAASTGKLLSQERAWSQVRSSHGDDKDLLVGGPEGRKGDQGSGLTMLRVNWNGETLSPRQSRVLTTAAEPAPIIGSRPIEIGRVWPNPVSDQPCSKSLTRCSQIRMKARFLLVMKFIDEMNA